MGVGVTFATIGILCGIILGMILINYGAKKGYTHVKMTFDEMPESERTGYIRPKERTSVGNGVTNASSLDPLAFQLAIVGVVGSRSDDPGMPLENQPGYERVSAGGSCSCIQHADRIFINKTSLRERIDRKLMSRITGTALEYMITAAIATTSKQIFYYLCSAINCRLHCDGSGKPVRKLCTWQALAGSQLV